MGGPRSEPWRSPPPWTPGTSSCSAAPCSASTTAPNAWSGAHPGPQTRRTSRRGRPLDFDLAVEIRRPPEVVYAFLVTKEQHPQPPGSPVLRLDRLTPGPAGVGTRWIEVVRVGPGMSMTVRSQADRVEPGLALGERFTSAWFTGRLTYTFEPTPTGTRLRQRQELRPRGPLALLARPIDNALRPRLLDRLADIRDLLENPPARQAT